MTDEENAFKRKGERESEGMEKIVTMLFLVELIMMSSVHHFDGSDWHPSPDSCNLPFPFFSRCTVVPVLLRPYPCCAPNSNARIANGTLRMQIHIKIDNFRMSSYIANRRINYMCVIVSRIALAKPHERKLSDALINLPMDKIISELNHFEEIVWSCAPATADGHWRNKWNECEQQPKLTWQQKRNVGCDGAADHAKDHRQQLWPFVH